MAGQTALTSVEYQVSDGQGGTDTATLTITVNGASTAPTADGTIGDQSSVDGSTTVPLDLSGFFSDSDSSDTLTYADNGSLPPGLTINPDTGLVTGTFDTSASVEAPYAVQITATDSTGLATSQTFPWDVINLAPTANDDFANTTENVSWSGSVILGDGADSDADGDAFSVTAVNGSPANIGIGVSGSMGGIFLVHASGAAEFFPGSDFDYLSVGQEVTTFVSYTLTDADGETSTAAVSLIVTGTNDQPTSTGTIATQSANDRDTIAPLDLSGFFDDIDAQDELEYDDNDTLPPGLSIDSETGVVSGTIDPGVSIDGPFEVSITVHDGNGGSATQRFVFEIDLAQIPDQESIAGLQIEPVDVSGPFTDALGDDLIFDSGQTLPPGLTIDPSTGIVSGDIPEDAAEVEPYVVTITATDGTTTLTQELNWQIHPPFAFDSFRDESEEEKQGDRDTDIEDGLYELYMDTRREVVLSRNIEKLGSEPILAGYASPGTVLIGRIYDANGSIIGESNLTVGPSGNWTMHFFGTEQSSNSRVVIEHVATENVAIGNAALKLTGETYRALQLDAATKPVPTAGTILDDAASQSLKESSDQNINPLGLL